MELVIFLPLGILGVLFRIILAIVLVASFSWGMMERRVYDLRTEGRSPACG